jgi:hypothetical protein
VTPSPASPPTRRRRPWALLGAVLAGAIVAAVAAAQDGAAGAGSAALGLALVVVFLGSGALPLLLVRGLEGQGAGLGLGVLLLNYSLRIALAVAVLTVAGRSDAVEPRWTALAVIAGALSWAAGQTLAVVASGRQESRPGPAPAGAGSEPSHARHDQPGHGPGALGL